MQQPPSSNRNQQGTEQRQAVQNSQSGGETAILDRTPSNVKKCVLQIATATIFDEEEMDYQPFHLLLDSGTQRTIIKSQFSRGLKLSVLRSTSFTTSGMDELQENFSSDKIHRLIEQDLLSSKTDHSSPVPTLPSELILTPTVFGYTISGSCLATWKAALAQIQEGALVVATPNVSSKNDYKQDIKHHYVLEAFGIKKRKTIRLRILY
ncbi:hypothetical protein OESDEN_00862 [Oesophagostomum dentatum]|uniref:Peptidase aspartic putative domain-containing protein n=1 Tax=Oesophagostomum dentatum TaxID=61180 RepID=A0A0B1TPK3_OESDE|nr:hypothetical protein OESDEN_00862 [Oesophagostomum dentatum]